MKAMIFSNPLILLEEYIEIVQRLDGIVFENSSDTLKENVEENLTAEIAPAPSL